MIKLKPKFKLVPVIDRVRDVLIGGTIAASLSNFRDICLPNLRAPTIPHPEISTQDIEKNLL
jgi:hypothetical protein